MSLEPKRLHEWQQLFETIYCKRNDKRSDESILLRLVEELSEVSEALREENFRLSEVAEARKISIGELEQELRINPEKIHILEWELPDVFAWLCAFATCVHHELEDDMWHKYPRICPYCSEKRNCLCIAKSPDEKPSKEKLEEKLSYARKNGKHPESLDDWQACIDRLYKKINRVQEEEVIGFHLHEEVGEVSREFRKMEEDTGFSQKDLSCEIADVFSWMLALASRMGLNMAEITWNKYPEVCAYCLEAECHEEDGQ
jgi:NTP pyrophosphatase (non-canonical NTP hydrolase)